MRKGVSIEQFVATCSWCELAEHPGYSCKGAKGLFDKPDNSGQSQLDRIESLLQAITERLKDIPKDTT